MTVRTRMPKTKRPVSGAGSVSVSGITEPIKTVPPIVS